MNTDQLRQYCLSLSGTTEGIKWEHICFMVADKIFCIGDFEDDGGMGFKVSAEDFELLTERDGIIQAPHFARGQWVLVSSRHLLKTAEWKTYLKKSYELVVAKLPKKIQASL